MEKNNLAKRLKRLQIIKYIIILILAIELITIITCMIVEGTSRTSSGSVTYEDAINYYNQSFTQYEGSRVRGSSVKFLCNVVRNHNLSATNISEKVGITLGTVGETEYSVSNLSDANTSSSYINNIFNQINAESTYTITFGYDLDTGYVTMIYIVEN